MKQTVLTKCLFIIISSSAILLVLAVGFHVQLNAQVQLVEIYVAAKDIMPRTRISENDLVEIHVPSAYLQDYTYTTKEDILGKYTEIQGMIPAGSPFYKSMLFNEEDLPDYPFTELRKGQAAYSMNVDLATLGGLLKKGQRVDIHYAFISKDDVPVTGCLIQNARIISIQDHRGMEIENKDSSGTPYLAILAVNEEDISLLTLADSLGQVKLITSSSTYDANEEAKLVKDSLVFQYLLQKQELAGKE